MRGGIHGRSLCISLGQSRCTDRRNRDNGRSTARHKAAKIRTDVRNVHHKLV